MIADIKLDFLSPYFDLQIVDNDLLTEDSLKTAIIISLFTDKRVTTEELPPEETSLRGWWSDALNDDKDRIGSKLWLLKRETITAKTLTRFKEYCEEALAWLVEDEIAEKVTVATERGGLNQVSIEIEVIHSHDNKISQKYAFIWENNNAVSETIIT